MAVRWRRLADRAEGRGEKADIAGVRGGDKVGVGAMVGGAVEGHHACLKGRLETTVKLGAFEAFQRVAVATARLDRARAQTRAADAALGPAVTLNAQVAELKQSYLTGIPPQFVPQGFNSTGRLALDLNWDLDVWGKNRKLLAAATSEAQAAQADVAQARLMLSTSVAAAYANLAQLYAERDVAAEAVEVRKATFDLTTQRVANGADTRAELKQAEAGPAAARADIAALDESIALTKNRLAALIGEGPDRGLSIQRPTAGAVRAFGLPANLAANLIGRRPDIVAARLRAEAMGKRIGAAKAAFYPDINLAGFAGFQSLPLNLLFNSGAETAQIGPAISLPILDSGRLNASYRGARADYDLAVASYDSALTTAVREVADAAASERALSIRLTESQAALAANEEAYRVARLRYEGGLASYQSVLLVENAVLQSRRIVADLQARAFLLDVQLVQALGGGFRGV